MIKNSNYISTVLVELYHSGDVSEEERKFIEAELETNPELRAYYESLEESDRELLERYPLENQPKLQEYLKTLEGNRRERGDEFKQNKDLKFPVHGLTNSMLKVRIPVRDVAVAGTGESSYTTFKTVETPPEIQPAGILIGERKKRADNLYDFRFNFTFDESIQSPPYYPEIEFLPSEKSKKYSFRMEIFVEYNSTFIYNLTNVECIDGPSECYLIINPTA